MVSERVFSPLGLAEWEEGQRLAICTGNCPPVSLLPRSRSEQVMRYIVLAVCLFISQVSSYCDTSQKRLGCRIQGKRCTCDEFSCTPEYRYPSFEECDNALRGKRADICHPNPCLNGGSCIQIAQQPGFKCRCEGTGYYGGKCNRACPRPGMPSRDIIFPYECIVI